MLDPVTATALSKAIAGAFSRLGGQQLADRVAALAHMQRAELRLLNQLRQDVERLLAEPFVTAGLLLSDAGQLHRSDDDRLRLLHEARGSLTRALALDSDPLRLSAAALLLAGVWVALESPEDAPALVSRAHQHAIQAALGLADTPRPPLPEQYGRGLIWRLLAPIPQVTWRRALKARPRSLRMHAVVTARTFVSL